MNPLEARKLDHLRLCLEEDVSTRHRTGFEAYTFMHDALPDLDLEAIDTRVTFLGRTFDAPLLISSMTGGPEMGRRINENLARAAELRNIPFALGSQRIIRERPETTASFAVKDVAPGVFLVGNVGAVQLNEGFTPADCQALVDAVGADALYLHLNPLQEAIQPGGDTRFRGLLPRIAEVCASLSVPVLVKEVGNGLAPDVSARLLGAGVRALDVAGNGGTSWARIEGLRSPDPLGRTLGDTFRDWGIPTAEAVRMNRAAHPEAPLVASGGLRTGIDLAKAIALGADLGGYALPFLEAATDSVEAVVARIDTLVQELRVAMFCLGCADLAALRVTDRLVEVR
jgi:isopentenyl-diphosphate delta-isomerase